MDVKVDNDSDCCGCNLKQTCGKESASGQSTGM